MSALVALLLLFAPDAVGQTPPTDTEPGANHAEYVRLQQELEKLAQRNAWSGVERTYQEMASTGVMLQFEDHLTGAHAARALGDIGAARSRLSAANALREGEREILEWLWDIDSNYGRVYLACEAGKHQLALTADSMPFNPDQRRAVEFAIAKVAETCEFDGLLPHGTYHLGTYEVQVQKVQNVRLDLRNMEIPVEKKKKSKKKDEEGAASSDGQTEPEARNPGPRERSARA